MSFLNLDPEATPVFVAKNYEINLDAIALVD